MQVRKTVFATKEIYHIFNRSIGREQIFITMSQLNHIIETVEFYRFPQTIRLSEYKKLNKEAKEVYLFQVQQRDPLVEIYAFSFMPNHYHFLLRQTAENGIKRFISLIQNSYAKYFNTRYERHGSLFQSPFQGKWIENDEQLLHVSRYIHLNHVTAYIITFEQLLTYPYCSLPLYLCNTTISWVNTELILDMFSSREAYRSFVEDQIDYQRTLAKIKDVTLE
jgi:putative transposase